MILTLQCSRCGSTLGIHIVSKKEATVEVNPCLLCIHREARNPELIAELVASKKWASLFDQEVTT